MIIFFFKFKFQICQRTYTNHTSKSQLKVSSSIWHSKQPQRIFRSYISEYLRKIPRGTLLLWWSLRNEALMGVPCCLTCLDVIFLQWKSKGERNCIHLKLCGAHFIEDIVVIHVPLILALSRQKQTDFSEL